MQKNAHNFFINLILYIKNLFSIRTYVIEMIVVWWALVITAIISGKTMIEWIGVIAVFLTFCYIQIADRLEEREHLKQQAIGYQKDKNSVECYYKLPRFYYSKEICRAIYFIYLWAWSALVWVILFILYIPWRKFYRKHVPIS